MKQFSLLAVVTLAFGLSAQAASPRVSMSYEWSVPQQRSFSVGVQPLMLLVGGIAGEGDVRWTDKSSLVFGGMYAPSRSQTSTSGGDYSYKASSYEMYVGPKFMISGSFQESGIYVNPALGYVGASITDYSPYKLSATINTPELRVAGGYQLVTSERLKFNFGAGLRVMKSAEIVVKDDSGKEVLKSSSGSLSGLVLDIGVAYLF